MKQINNNLKINKHWVRITKCCNNRCLFCLDKETQDQSVIPINKIYKDLKKGINHNAKRAILSGGDPTLHPDFIPIIEFAKKLGYVEIQCITNGRMFAYKGFLKDAVDAGLTEITFSMHGHNSKLHDTLTGINGSFKQSISGLRNAVKSSRLVVNVDIVLNKLNIKKIREIIIFFINEGVREFELLQIIPFGRAWDNKKLLFYDTNKNMTYLKKALKLHHPPALFLWTNRFPPEFLEGFECLIQNPNKLEEEISARKSDFEAFIKKGTPLYCSGSRCEYCFLKYFCLDLAMLKKKGSLSPKKIPECLRKYPEAEKYFKKTRIFKKTASFNILKFLEFYIKNRYFLKGDSCKKCKHTNKCCGQPINYCIDHGFKKPI